jgi:hypothetical protein
VRHGDAEEGAGEVARAASRLDAGSVRDIRIFHAGVISTRLWSCMGAWYPSIFVSGGRGQVTSGDQFDDGLQVGRQLA